MIGVKGIVEGVVRPTFAAVNGESALSRQLTQLAMDSAAALTLVGMLGAVYTFDHGPLPAVQASASDSLARIDEDRRAAPTHSDEPGQTDQETDDDRLPAGLAAEFAVSGPRDATALASGPPIIIPGIEPRATTTGIKPQRPTLFGRTAPPVRASARAPAQPPPVAQPIRKPLEVEFFGIRSEATTVAFVVDCSGSMEGEKFEQVRFHLAKSIVNLQPEQAFYVVFFNDRFFPMFGLRSHFALVQGTAAMKVKCLHWLAQARPSEGTNPEPALFFTSQFRTQRIDFLTDGQFPPLSPRTMNALLSHSIKVNCVAFGQDCDANNLRSIALRTGGIYKLVTPRGGLPNLYFAPPEMLRNALRSSNAEIRTLAMRVIFGLELPLASEIVDVLQDPDLELRNDVHQELIRVAAGSDFGPSDDSSAEIAAAVSRWHKWTKWRSSTVVKTIAEKLASANTDDRWVGAAIVRQRGFSLLDELIAIVGDANRQIRREAHAALTHLAKGPDFGPQSDATQAEVAEAARKWTAWRADALAAAAVAKAAEREKQAGNLLRVAKKFLSQAEKDNNFQQPAQEKLERIVHEFPDTTAAAEARTLLAK